MKQASYPVLMGAFVATVALGGCSGASGGGSVLAPSVQATPQAAATPAAVATQKPQATAQPTPVPTPTPVAIAAIARIVVTIGGTPVAGTPGTYPLTIVAESSSGAAIKGPYGTPIVLSDADSSGATKLSATSVSNSTAVVTLAYNGVGGSTLGGFDGAVISATNGAVSDDVAFLSNGTTCVTFKQITGYYPCDLQSAYSLPSLSAGAGKTIAIVDAFDDPRAEADMGVYRSQFGLPPCTAIDGCFKKVNQNGVAGDLPSIDTTGWSLEESLDLDMVSAVCPKCHILLVEGNSSSLDDLSVGVDSAARLGANAISNSYGSVEGLGENAYDVHYDHPKTMIVVSSGDSDYGVAYPASSPFVTAVGGTNLTVAANARGWNEFVWNNANVQGTGSGCSAYEPKPSWQTDAGCPKNRLDNDVAVVADPYSGVAVYDTYVVAGYTLGGWATLGGTSAGAPIIAATYALGGASAATLHYGSYSYSHPSELTDVTNGADGTCATTILYFCTAGAGYDGPTGNGTPNGTGGFGGPSVAAAQSMPSARRTFRRRNILQAPPGTPTHRVCPAKQLPGYASCFAILVSPT